MSTLHQLTTQSPSVNLAVMIIIIRIIILIT